MKVIDKASKKGSFLMWMASAGVICGVFVFAGAGSRCGREEGNRRTGEVGAGRPPATSGGVSAGRTVSASKGTVVPTRRGSRQSIDIGKLQGLDVNGVLGWPLGTIMTVEGVVLDETARRSKMDLGKTLLRVERIGGKPLARARVVHLRDRSGSLKLEPKQRFHLLGYETGGFEGVPHGLFKYVPAFTARGFYFNSWFVPILPEKQ